MLFHGLFIFAVLFDIYLFLLILSEMLHGTPVAKALKDVTFFDLSRPEGQ